MEEFPLRALQSVVISDADFPISASQNQFKQSATAMLAVTFILFVAYSVVKFWSNRKTGFGTDVIIMSDDICRKPRRSRKSFR